MKVFVNFGEHSPQGNGETHLSVTLPAGIRTGEQVQQAAVDAVDQVKTDLLQARKQGIPVTLGLPEQPVLACAVLQAVRGVLGYVPYVALSPAASGEEIDLEEVREAARALL